MKSVYKPWADQFRAKESDQMAASTLSLHPSLDAILADPDNDEPRKGYAALLPVTDSRREFILDQLEAARLNFDFSIPECRSAYSNSQWLLRENYDRWGPAWSGWIQSQIYHYDFNRGFVELICLCADTFLRSAEDIFRAAPIRHIDFVESADMWSRLAKSEWLAGIQSISLSDNDLADQDIIHLAASPYLKQLRWLTLTNNRDVTKCGVEAMAAHARTNLPNLCYIGLDGAAFNPVEEYAADGDMITWQSLPEAGRELERRHGYLPWLHVHAVRTSEIPPDRFQIAHRTRANAEMQYLGCQLRASDIYTQGPSSPAQTLNERRAQP